MVNQPKSLVSISTCALNNYNGQIDLPENTLLCEIIKWQAGLLVKEIEVVSLGQNSEDAKDILLTAFFHTSSILHFNQAKICAYHYTEALKLLDQIKRLNN